MSVYVCDAIIRWFSAMIVKIILSDKRYICREKFCSRTVPSVLYLLLKDASYPIAAIQDTR